MSLQSAIAPSQRRWRWLALACLLALLLCLLTLLPYLGSGTELVRLRNAWSLQQGANPDFHWQAGEVPASFRQEPGPVPAEFASAAARLQLASLPDDWQRAAAISRHLLTGSPVLNGGAIQSDLLSTYRRIVEQGDGYCGDFTRVFIGLALAAGMPVRLWAFSFDGFGGHGHVWPEIWNRQRRQWQLVDVFNNAYFTGPEGEVLSALAFRHWMLTAPERVGIMRLVPQARPGFIHEARARDYYRRGLHQWYLLWGNNVFEYDRVVRPFAGLHRGLEQLAGLALGALPQVAVLEDPASRAQRDALQRLRWQLHLIVIVGGLALPGLLLGIWGGWRKAAH